MGSKVLIIGESGSGKSSAIRTLNPAETFIINVLNKPLPFKGGMKSYVAKPESGNYYSTDNAQTIVSICRHINTKRPEIKNIVIDDYQYIMANEFMRKALEKGYEKFSTIGKMGWEVINNLSELRQDLDCFILSHNDIGEDGRSRCKTIGKMITDKICLEGMFTIVLHTSVANGVYKLITNADPHSAAKSAMGMFKDALIDNDLQFVKNKMNEYFYEDVAQ